MIINNDYSYFIKCAKTPPTAFSETIKVFIPSKLSDSIIW